MSWVAPRAKGPLWPEWRLGQTHPHRAGFAGDPYPLLLRGPGVPSLSPSDGQWLCLSTWHLHRWTGLTDTTLESWVHSSTSMVHTSDKTSSWIQGWKHRPQLTGHFILPVTLFVTGRENSMGIKSLESDVTAGGVAASLFVWISEKWTWFPMLALEDLERRLNSNQAELVIWATPATDFCYMKENSLTGNLY